MVKIPQILLVPISIDLKRPILVVQTVHSIVHTSPPHAKSGVIPQSKLTHKGLKTMAHLNGKIDREDWAACMCCGRHIKLLGNHQRVILFLGEASARRRGLRCMNCGQIACIECSGNGCRCACKGNAWVALPYLDKKTEEPARTDPA